MEMSTSSSAGVLVNHSQSQETAKDLTAQAVLCGNTSDVFEKLNQLGSCGKTSQARYRHRRGEDFRCLLVALAELGYCLSWRVLDAQYFGVPQARRRVYVVGHLGDDSSIAILFDRESLSRDTQTLRKSRATSPVTDEGSLREASTYTLHIHHGRSDNGGGRGAMIKTDISPTICASARPTIFCRGNHHSKAACYEELAPTLTAHAKAEAPLISLTPPRHLTPRECERLQGFPDDWTAVLMPNGKPVSNTQRYKMLGNSMAVPVMRWIGARILLVERSNNAN